MPKENNKMQVDIDTLKKQNVNDLLSIKELYSKLEELGEKITQIKYVDNTIVKKLKKEYENFKKLILDENLQLQFKTLLKENNKVIDDFNVRLDNDINEINSQLDTMARKDDVAKISSGTPLFASSISGMTDTTKNYVNTTDGYLYIYSGGTWNKTSVQYQSTGISEGSVNGLKLDKNNNIFNNLTFRSGYALNSDGTEKSFTSFSTSDYFDITDILSITLDNNMKGSVYPVQGCFYDSNKTFISKINSTVLGLYTVKKPINAKYLKINYINAMKDSTILYCDYLLPKSFKVNKDNIDSMNVTISDINSSNVNVYNKNNLIANSFVDKTGTITTLNKLYRTDYIDIHNIVSMRLLNKLPSTNGDTYITPLCCFYDINKTFLSYVEIKKVGDVNVTIPSGAYYVIINFHLTYLDDYYIYYYKKIDWLVTEGKANTKGKLMECIGDSLTAYAKWQPTVVDRLGLSGYNNLALAGGYLTNNMAQYLVNLNSGVDIITIWAGTNDWSYGKLLGSFTDEVAPNVKYVPTLRYMIEYICQNRPSAKLFLITPHQRFANTPSGSPNTSFTQDERGNYKNSNGDTLEDFANAIIEVGKYYSIPVIDLYHEGVVNKINYTTYLVDKIHHNENGGILHGTIIANEISKYF